MDLTAAATVAVFAMFAAVVDKIYVVVPLFMALIFPTYPIAAAFIGLIAVLVLGNVARLIQTGP